MAYFRAKKAGTRRSPPLAAVAVRLRRRRYRWLTAACRTAYAWHSDTASRSCSNGRSRSCTSRSCRSWNRCRCTASCRCQRGAVEFFGNVQVVEHQGSVHGGVSPGCGLGYGSGFGHRAVPVKGVVLLTGILQTPCQTPRPSARYDVLYCYHY